VAPLIGAPVLAAPGDYFRITVVDQDTGRGVPLVELRTVNEVRFYTDSNGIVAVGDPELMGQKVFFRVTSPGYQFPADNMGYRGLVAAVTPGGSVVIQIKRDNIAERLYRITGAGIYRDSVLTGQQAPLRQPLLNGQVMGQDTVEVTPYQGKLYWFFGDTNKPSYPLGQFATSGATSLLPGKGGLDPDAGVDLTYWVGTEGFSRPMIPLPKPLGPIWVGGLFTMKDGDRPHLFTRYTEISHGESVVADGLAEFNDEKAVFEPVCTYPKEAPLRPEGHPFLAENGGQRYLYFQATVMGAFPLVRAVPDRAHVTDAARFEAFTCLAPGARFQGSDTRLDRAADGHLIWGWKRDTAPLGEDQADKLVAAGKMRADERLNALRDVDTDEPVLSHGGSVFWNPYHKRWILITTQVYGKVSYLGEIWYAEADTPVGPWLYARQVVTHGGYTFYNPTQHPFFDSDGGRLVYFEGTYTDTYSKIKDLTPRYNYNQLMYRLNLADSRLSLPTPVYRLVRGDGLVRYGTREGIDAGGLWSSVLGIPFYAVPPGRAAAGLVPLYANQGTLTLTAPAAGATPLCYVLPATPAAAEKTAPNIVPLYAFHRPGGAARWYAPDATGLPEGVMRDDLPICRVWRNPSSVLALDWQAKAVTME